MCDLSIRVIPRASKTGVAGLRDGAVLVRVGAAPVDGAANAQVLRTLADALGLPLRALTLVSGHTSRTKRIRIDGLTADAALRQLGLAP
ncbi:MAG: DUF167 domain-containing protein [Acidobacteria bacterium]|nr:DUF167 domain-containing protein [Acidobacteriota bacterium]